MTSSCLQAAVCVVTGIALLSLGRPAASQTAQPDRKESWLCTFQNDDWLSELSAVNLLRKFDVKYAIDRDKYGAVVFVPTSVFDRAMQAFEPFPAVTHYWGQNRRKGPPAATVRRANMSLEELSAVFKKSGLRLLASALRKLRNTKPGRRIGLVDRIEYADRPYVSANIIVERTGYQADLFYHKAEAGWTYYFRLPIQVSAEDKLWIGRDYVDRPPTKLLPLLLTVNAATRQDVPWIGLKPVSYGHHVAGCFGPDWQSKVSLQNLFRYFDVPVELERDKWGIRFFVPDRNASMVDRARQVLALYPDIQDRARNYLRMRRQTITVNGDSRSAVAHLLKIQPELVITGLRGILRELKKQRSSRIISIHYAKRRYLGKKLQWYTGFDFGLLAVRRRESPNALKYLEVTFQSDAAGKIRSSYIGLSRENPFRKGTEGMGSVEPLLKWGK